MISLIISGANTLFPIFPVFDFFTVAIVLDIAGGSFWFAYGCLVISPFLVLVVISRAKISGYICSSLYFITYFFLYVMVACERLPIYRYEYFSLFNSEMELFIGGGASFVLAGLACCLAVIEKRKSRSV